MTFCVPKTFCSQELAMDTRVRQIDAPQPPRRERQAHPTGNHFLPDLIFEPADDTRTP
jgi:hypothetical protein